MVGATGIFTVGAALGSALDTQTPQIGTLQGIAAGILALLATFRSWLRQRDRMFTHGFHAGFHAGRRDTSCSYPQECEVLSLAERRARAR